jgi:hypothetical protein
MYGLCSIYCAGIKMNKRFQENLKNGDLKPEHLSNTILDDNFIELIELYEFDSSLPFIEEVHYSTINFLIAYDFLSKLTNFSTLTINNQIQPTNEPQLIKFLYKANSIKELKINCDLSQTFLDYLHIICPNLTSIYFKGHQISNFNFIYRLKYLKKLIMHQHIELNVIKNIIINCNHFTFGHFIGDSMRIILNKKYDEITIYDDKYNLDTKYTSLSFVIKFFNTFNNKKIIEIIFQIL